MNTMLLGLYVKFENLVSSEEGHDLIEYARVLAMIVCVVTACLRTVAVSISTELSVIESGLASAVV